MHSSPFSVAGMTASTSGHHHHQFHGPNLSTWGSGSTSGPLASSFSDTLSQSRSQYQSGYLMSSQSNNSPQGSQRVDDVPVVPTKAKMSHVLSRGSASDFGMDSMFQSTRQRQKFTDEDAPPTASVNDIPHEVPVDTNPARFQPHPSLDTSTFPRRSQQSQPHTPSQQQQSHQPLYIIVFGYPPDKYSVTVEYFRSFGGESTEPDPNLEIINCFRIGYKDAGDALRAVRKNGEVLGGSWMVGVKWADPLQAEAVLGHHGVGGSGALGSHSLPSDLSQSMSMSVDPQSNPTSPSHPAPANPTSNAGTPVFGTPIRLVPSTSAFKKSGSKTSTPQAQNQAQGQIQRGWGPGIPGVSASASAPALDGGSSAAMGGGAGTGTPGKGMLGQVSDLIFGW